MISGCSTLPPAERLAPDPVKISDFCPPPQAFADWNDFTATTKAKKGEAALKTAQRFRIAELKKNAAGQRLWMGLKRCRAKDAVVPPPEKPAAETNSIASIFGE